MSHLRAVDEGHPSTREHADQIGDACAMPIMGDSQTPRPVSFCVSLGRRCGSLRPEIPGCPASPGGDWSPNGDPGDQDRRHPPG